MKNLRRNVSVLIIALCFLGFGLISASGNVQTKASVKPSPTVTPKSKKSTASAKTTPKPSPASQKAKATVKTDSAAKSKTTEKSKSVSTEKSADTKSTPKPTAAPQIIVAVTSANVRSESNLNSKIVKTLNIGTILPVLEVNSGWYKVKLNDGSGWISKTISMNFDSAQRGKIYQQLVEKYFKGKEMDFAAASQIAVFLKTAPDKIGNELAADFGFKRLLALSAALKKIPFGKSDEDPYKNFVKTNEKEIVYSDPSGEWYIRSEVFWELHNQYKNLPIGEEIAWQAAQNPIPGECEGYINCYLYALRVTDGEYLNFYPGGKYSKKALQNISNLLAPMVADLKEKNVYTPATDISDRAEFNRYLAELRTIISRVPYVEKSKPLQQINQLGEGYR